MTFSRRMVSMSTSCSPTSRSCASVTAAPLLDRSRTTAVYVLVLVVGVAAFLYPFWIPGEALNAALNPETLQPRSEAQRLMDAAESAELKRQLANETSRTQRSLLLAIVASLVLHGLGSLKRLIQRHGPLDFHPFFFRQKFACVSHRLLLVTTNPLRRRRR